MSRLSMCEVISGGFWIVLLLEPLCMWLYMHTPIFFARRTQRALVPQKPAYKFPRPTGVSYFWGLNLLYCWQVTDVFTSDPLWYMFALLLSWFCYRVSLARSALFGATTSAPCYFVLILLPCMMMLQHTTDLIHVLFVLETLSLVYYSFFLHCTPSVLNRPLSFYKTFLLFYFWASLLGLLFLVLGLVWAHAVYGSLAFSNLALVVSRETTDALQFFVLGVFVKLGLPLAHFIKYEVYRHLPFDALLSFMSCAYCINLYLMIWVLGVPGVELLAFDVSNVVYVLFAAVAFWHHFFFNYRLVDFLTNSSLYTLLVALMFYFP